jgi:hypothetical protein
VVRAIDSDPALRSVVGEAGKVQSSMALMQRLFDAGKDGTRRQSLVDLMPLLKRLIECRMRILQCLIWLLFQRNLLYKLDVRAFPM